MFGGSPDPLRCLQSSPFRRAESSGKGWKRRQREREEMTGREGKEGMGKGKERERSSQMALVLD